MRRVNEKPGDVVSFVSTEPDDAVGFVGHEPAAAGVSRVAVDGW
jgi:hypothetical protein